MGYSWREMGRSCHESKECCSVLKERRKRNGRDRVLTRNGDSKEGSKKLDRVAM